MKPLLCSLALLAIVAPLLSLSAEPLPAAMYELHIASQPLGSALQDLAGQSGIQIVFYSAVTRGLTAPALQGRYSVEQALRALLAGTHLDFREIDRETIEIVERADARSGQGPRVSRQMDRQATSAAISEVVVTGTTQGLVATRTETALREIPQTLVTISNEQIRQQNDLDVTDVLKHATGVTLKRTNSLDQDVYVRGYQVTSLHVDGGAALNSQSLVGVPLLGMPDLSEFERVEVLRGADGLFGSDGNPGATISLVRKRPREAAEMRVSALAGSWQNYRAEADLTGPLNDGGALRGRLDAMYTSRNYFFETANYKRQRLFGVLEYAPNSASSLLIGGSYQRDDAIPFSGGLPLVYSDGSGLDLPRNTALTFSWSNYHGRLGELYFEWERNFGNNWKLKLNATGWRGSLEYVLGEFTSTVEPVTRGLAGAPSARASTRPNTQRQAAANLTITGTYSLFGRPGEIALGADFTRVNAAQAVAFYMNFQPPVQDILAYDPSMYADPRLTQTPYIEIVTAATAMQSGLFAASKFRLSEGSFLVTGARLGDSRINTRFAASAGSITLNGGNRIRNAGVLTPYAGASYALSDRYSLYASYADIVHIVNPASRADGKLIGPIHGVNIEAGLKAAWRDGQLQGALALYGADQHDVPVPVAPPPGLLNTPPHCCYRSASNRSRGIDLEVNGSLTPNWLIAAGYTYNTNEAAPAGRLSTATPRHLFKLWTSERLPGRLTGWTVGGDLHVQSSNFDSGQYCSQQVASGSCTGIGDFTAIQGRFVVVGLRASYRINTQWQVALNVNNVFDANYFENIGEPGMLNWYGEPRNFALRFDFVR